MFPENSGVYYAQRDNDVIIVKVKGIYPALRLDDNAFDLGLFLKTGKKQEVSKEVLNNIELFHQRWDFKPIKFNFGVFSKTEFKPDGSRLYMSEEDMLALRSMYYRLCQQGVQVWKVIRAVSYEFKVSTDQIVRIVNEFDRQ